MTLILLTRHHCNVIATRSSKLKCGVSTLSVLVLGISFLSGDSHEITSCTTSPCQQVTFSRALPGSVCFQGNTLELTIANTSPITTTQVSVEATGLPSSVSYSQKTVTIDQLSAKSEKPVTFSFSIDKMAAVNKEETLTFTVKLKSGETWTKEIKIKVAPPEKFELFQNYPNPFNPTTTICYQLTRDSKVQLKVYNLLGQEVVTLVDGDKQAGYHQEVFDATRFASGLYIYRIVYTNESGKQSSDKKTMLVLK